MGRRVAVVSMFDDNYSQMAEITLHQNFKMYCDIHGYDLIPFHLEDSFLEGRHPQWCKIKLIKKILEDGKYDWVFFVDCDCLIMNLGNSLDNLIDNQYDMILPIGGGAQDKNLGDDVYSNNIMTSQMLVKNSTGSIDILQEIWDAPDWPENLDINEFDHEMRQLRISYNKPQWKEKIKLVDENKLNTFWPINNPFLVDSFPHILDNLWKPGDFIAHVVAYPKIERIEILKMLTNFVGGVLARWYREGNRIYFKPLINLDYAKISLHLGNIEKSSWEWNDLKRDMVYWLTEDLVETEDLLDFTAKDSGGNVISAFRFYPRS